MRIISQDRTIDVPYDNVVVYVHNQSNQIYVKMYVSGIDYNREGFSIGKYHNKEDAICVMSHMRDKFPYATYYHMPLADDVDLIRDNLDYAGSKDGM